jgi:hypothetical protein
MRATLPHTSSQCCKQPDKTAMIKANFLKKLMSNSDAVGGKKLYGK